MFKSKLGLILAVLCVLTLVFGACGDSSDQKMTTSDQKMTAKAVFVPNRVAPETYLDVTIKVSGEQPCKLVLAKRVDPEYDNYLYLNSSAPLTYPDSDGNVVFHVLIPSEAIPGSYILKLVQVTQDGDTEGMEIFTRSCIVTYHDYQ